MPKTGRSLIGTVAGFKSEWWPVFDRNAGRLHVGIRSLEDDQIELVTGVVRNWCEESGRSVNSQAGREAMEVAIRIVVSKRLDPAELAALLAKLMAVRGISGISYCP